MSMFDESVVAGVRMERSIKSFAHACEQYIQEESAKLLPDTGLISVLCDAVRLTREIATRSGGLTPLGEESHASVNSD